MFNFSLRKIVLSFVSMVDSGAQIIDMMVLVIDAVKGVQTQTAECIVIGEVLCRKLIVVVNKIDLLELTKCDLKLAKIHKNLRKVFAGTAFGANIPIYNIAAQSGQNIQVIFFVNFFIYEDLSHFHPKISDLYFVECHSWFNTNSPPR